MDGFTTIKVLKQERSFLEKFYSGVDLNSSALLNFISAQRWLGSRIEIIGAFVVFVPALAIVCFNNTLHLGAGIGELMQLNADVLYSISYLMPFHVSSWITCN